MLQLNSTDIRQFPIAGRRLKIRVSGVLAIQLTTLGDVIARFQMKIRLVLSKFKCMSWTIVNTFS